MPRALKPLSELFEMARDRVLMDLPNETYQSYPILVPGGQDPEAGRAVFLYGGLRSVRGKGRFFRAPYLRATLEARGGDLVSRDRVTPADLGVAHAPEETIGLHVLAKGLTPDEYADRRKRLFELYDRLAAAFLEQREGRAERAAAAEFRGLFFTISEEPLAPYYRAVGRSFFSWAEQLGDLP